MSENTSKWLVGCGIGCGALILLVVIIIGVGYFLVKDTVEDFRDVEVSMEIIEDTYGIVEDFCPDPDGRIRPERVEAFLTVRDSTSWMRADMEHSLSTITRDIRRVEDEDKSFWGVLGIIRKGMGAIPRMADYYSTRNYTLLDEGMSLGEYYYIYVIVYYSYLGRLPEDGPEFQLMGGDESSGRSRWYQDDEDEEDRDRHEDDVREERRFRIIRNVRRMTLPMLRNQLAKLKEESSAQYSRIWRRALVAEIDAMEEDRDRLPWEDGLPSVIKNSLEPYRDRLVASYSELLNPLELMPED